MFAYDLNSAGEVRAELKEMWRHILQVDDISDDDGFIDLGGDSKSALSLAMAIKNRFGLSLTLTTILAYSTFGELAIGVAFEQTKRRPAHISTPAPEGPNATALVEPLEKSGGQYLVSLQPRGDLPPLFGVHPLFGLVYPYAALARHLPKCQPFYALQAQGFEDSKRPFKTIEEMAEAYIHAIRSVQPEGPYYIGGWSFGSLVALEIARRLQNSGEEVASLMIIDQAIDSIDLFLTKTSIRIQAQRLLEILSAVIRIYEPAFGSGLNLFTIAKHPVDFTRFFFKIFLPMAKIGLINRAAAIEYRLPQYSGDIALLHTGDPEFTRISDERLGWDTITTGRVDVFRLAGAHFTLHEPPHVEGLASAVAAALEEARSRQLDLGRTPSSPRRKAVLHPE